MLMILRPRLRCIGFGPTGANYDLLFAGVKDAKSQSSDTLASSNGATRAIDHWLEHGSGAKVASLPGDNGQCFGEAVVRRHESHMGDIRLASLGALSLRAPDAKKAFGG